MAEETKIAYYIGEEMCPYVIKVNIRPGAVTLKDFKSAINKPNYKFFFRSEDDDFGVVKEEIRDDSSILPVSDNRIVAWLVPSEEAAAASHEKPSKQPDEVSIGKRSETGTPNRPDDASSVCSSRRGLGNFKQMPSAHDRYGSQSTLMSSDIDASSYDSRDDMSDYSTLSETTASSRFKLRDRRKERKKRRPKRGSDTTSTYSSSITDSSLSLNILTVNLNMEKYNFLGISIVGQTNDNGDGGIYIGSIMKGGAVAADGRIEPGDMLLQVNDVNFENMSNEEAVKVLRDIVHQPGPITLTVAKCWDPIPDRNYFVPKNEPVRPIDPAVWASQTIAAQGCYSGVSPPYSTHLESSSASSLPESERYLNDMPLTITTEMSHVVKTLRKANSGLDVKTRMWLKITIPNAFIGSDLIDWLQQRIDGLQERRAARKYASSLLKAGYIRHTVNKVTFSEQCYYVFGDYTGGGNRDMSIGDNSNNSNSDRDSDTLGPLPTTGSAIVPPWAAIGHAPQQPTSSNGFPSYQQQQQYIPGQPAASNMQMKGDHHLGGSNGSNVGGHTLDFPVAPQSYPGLTSDMEALSVSGSQRHGSIYGGGHGSSGSDRNSESRCSIRSGDNRSVIGHSNNQPPPTSHWEQSQRSYDVYNVPPSPRLGYHSANNSLHRRNMTGAYQFPPRSVSTSMVLQQSTPQHPPNTGHQRFNNPMGEMPAEMSTSRLSFQRAMGDPHDHFVDVI